MKANEGNFLQLLTGTDKRFVIPVYQRAYSWQVDNCSRLISDLMNVYNKHEYTHFLGSIVYAGVNVGGKNEYTIIDGQQRLTTVSLLLLAIRQFIIDNNVECDASRISVAKIKNEYLVDTYADDEPKLVPIDDDAAAYRAIVRNGERISGHTMTINYEFFYSEIKKYCMKDSAVDLDVLYGLYEAISKLEFVNVTLDADDDPQLIFESLNSTGLGLEESDKVRNYVLMNFTHKEQKEIFKMYWKPIENKVGKENMSRFIRYYMAVKTGELCTESRLYYAFKRFAKKENLQNAVLPDMLRYAVLFGKIQSCTETAGPAHERHIARMLQKLDINIVIPLLLVLLNMDSIDDAERERAMQVLESYLVRRIVCGLSMASLNKIFVKAAGDIPLMMDEHGIGFADALARLLVNEKKAYRFSDDARFEEAFVLYEIYNAKVLVKKYFLERLENAYNKERVDVENQIDKRELTIEHVMPQTLTSEWKDYLGDSWELIHTKYIDTIGNITLTAYNSEYSNKSFDEKKTLCNADGQMIGFASSKLWLNEYLKTCDVWNEDNINKRAKILFEKAKTIWAYPQAEMLGYQWVSLDEVGDITGKTIVKVDIFGEVTETDSSINAYKQLHAYLYNKDAQRYMSVDGLEQKINTSADAMREPVELPKSNAQMPTVYIEKNINNNEKIASSRRVYEAFGLELTGVRLLLRNT